MLLLGNTSFTLKCIISFLCFCHVTKESDIHSRIVYSFIKPIIPKCVLQLPKGLLCKTYLLFFINLYIMTKGGFYIYDYYISKQQNSGKLIQGWGMECNGKSQSWVSNNNFFNTCQNFQTRPLYLFHTISINISVLFHEMKNLESTWRKSNDSTTFISH